MQRASRDPLDTQQRPQRVARFEHRELTDRCLQVAARLILTLSTLSVICAAAEPDEPATLPLKLMLPKQLVHPCVRKRLIGLSMGVAVHFAAVQQPTGRVLQGRSISTGVHRSAAPSLSSQPAPASNPRAASLRGRVGECH